MLNIVRNGTLTTGSPVVTALSKTSDLLAGNHFVYGSKITPCTKILTVDSPTQITLNTNAVDTGIISLTFTDLVPYKYQELCEALKDVQQVVNNEGLLVEIIFRDEANVTRDDYKSIKTRAQTPGKYYLKSFPVIENPTEKQIEKAGLREMAGCIMWFSWKDFIDNSITDGMIDITRSTVKYNGATYAIRQKNLVSQFGNNFLYLTLGLDKK